MNNNKKERHGLKFSGYIFIPKDGENLKQYSIRLGMGKISFDDKKTEKHFKHIGRMFNMIIDEYEKKSRLRLRGNKNV